MLSVFRVSLGLAAPSFVFDCCWAIALFGNKFLLIQKKKNKILGSSVETIECAKRTMEYHYLLLLMFALENAFLRVYIGMMDDY